MLAYQWFVQVHSCVPIFARTCRRSPRTYERIHGHHLLVSQAYDASIIVTRRTRTRGHKMEVPRDSGQGDLQKPYERAEAIIERARRVDSRGVRCHRRFWHLASSALGRLVHRETRVPMQGGTPFAASRRLTSPRVPTSKSLIMATRPRPPPPQYI